VIADIIIIYLFYRKYFNVDVDVAFSGPELGIKNFSEIHRDFKIE